MDRLFQWIEHVRAQLSVLTVSQRSVICLCAVIIAGSLLWLSQWSSVPEMVPLVTHEFGFDELQAAEESLRSAQIDFQVLGGSRIYVGLGDRHNALRVVHGADALPNGSLFDMSSVISDGNPFQSPDARRYAQTYAKGNELAKIIATAPAVRKASVIINPVTKRRLGGVTDVPTASVTVTLAANYEMSSEMVEGFAKLVAGGVGGLKPHNVYITDARSLRSYSVPRPGDAASFDMLSMMKRHEEHFRTKILGKLVDIPSVQVEVSVELDTSKRVTQNVKHSAPQVKTETTNSAEQTASSQATEPGVQANLGQALSVGGGEGGSNTEETAVENFEPKLTQTETIEQMPFGIRKITAAIGIPRSFIVGVMRAQQPDLTDNPKDDDPQFVAIRDAQLARVRASVLRITMAKPEDVEVDVYPDMDWSADGSVWSSVPGGLALARQSGETHDTMGMVEHYGPQAGLAVLALASMFMMMRVVRKSTESFGTPRRLMSADTVTEEEEIAMSVGSSAVGQAEVSESMLTGKEVDPETLRFQEIGKEVSQMVEDDPAGSADLIRRWLDDS